MSGSRIARTRYDGHMLTAAGGVLFVLGLVHSVLGEIRLFRGFPREAFPTVGFPPIVGAPDSLVPTLHVCWHLLTVLGWMLASILAFGAIDQRTVQIIAAALSLCAVLVAIWTRGKHIGWLGFSAAAVLCWAG